VGIISGSSQGSSATKAQSDRRSCILVCDPSKLFCDMLEKELQRLLSRDVLVNTEQNLQKLHNRLLEKPTSTLLIADEWPDSKSGTEAFAQLRSQFAELRAIVVAGSCEYSSVVRVFRSGACGIVYRTDSLQRVCECIRETMGGDSA
jgi:DNA-binding NarL/FixJ family response regulator